MSWFLFAILGYFLYAVVTVFNKFLLHQKATTKPFVFTFWVGIFSIFTFILIPFGLHWPGWSFFIFDIFVGVVYYVALLAYYWALDVNEASRAASIVGGFTPILVLILAFMFLGDKLTWLQLIAFFLLVGGGFLISLKMEEGNLKEGMKGLKFIILTILLGAVYWILAKFAYQNQGFITGFVWTRMGLVAGSLLILLYKPWRSLILGSVRQASVGMGSLMVSSKIIAGFGSLFVNLALSRGSASLTNAMQGIEYVFLFGLTLLFSMKFPQILREKQNGVIIIQKIIAILLIASGLAILAF